MMLGLAFLLVGVFALLLMKSTDIIIEALRQLVVSFQVSPYGAAAFLLAFSTSLPELVVGIAAAVNGNGSLALGNIVGSNIANVSLVLGGAALVSGSLRATDAFLRREVFYVFLAGSFPLLLLVDKELSRVDGLVLMAVYVLYNWTVLEKKRKMVVTGVVKDEPMWHRVLVRIGKPKVEKNMGKLTMGVAMLIISAYILVQLAGYLATALGVPALLVGLFVVAVGTSLPELAFEVTAIAKREVQMAFGNILGSVVANSTGILGLIALVSPLGLGEGLPAYLVATLAFVGIFFIFWALVWTKHRLERWEGGLLVLVYLVFVMVEWWRR